MSCFHFRPITTASPEVASIPGKNLYISIHFMLVFTVNCLQVNHKKNCTENPILPQVIYNPIRDHSSNTSAKRLVGGVRKWQFLLIYSTIYADVGGWA